MTGEMTEEDLKEYPDVLELAEKIRIIFPGKDVIVRPFDKYRGPYIDIDGIGEVWRSPSPPGDLDYDLNAWLLECRRKKIDELSEDELLNILRKYTIIDDVFNEYVDDIDPKILDLLIEKGYKIESVFDGYQVTLSKGDYEQTVFGEDIDDAICEALIDTDRKGE